MLLVWTGFIGESMIILYYICHDPETDPAEPWQKTTPSRAGHASIESNHEIHGLIFFEIPAEVKYITRFEIKSGRPGWVSVTDSSARRGDTRERRSPHTWPGIARYGSPEPNLSHWVTEFHNCLLVSTKVSEIENQSTRVLKSQFWTKPRHATVPRIGRPKL